MRVLSKLTAATLAMALTFGAFGNVVSAKETPSMVLTNDDISSGEDIATTDSEADALQARSTRVVYTDSDLTVYTGSGSARWLHITVKDIPAVPIKLWMEDYNGKTVWTDYIRSTGTTDWYVGADVRYVKLRGGPSQVSFYNTAN